MSLKFGIYLVEQRVVTPEQFCGLVKIQQESVATGGRIALDRNLMTIKQVSNVIDAQPSNNKKSFQQIAVEMGYISSTEANLLVKAQECSSPSIRSLSIECGLLTPAQCRMLFTQFERSENTPMAVTQKIATKAQITAPAPAPSENTSTQPSTKLQTPRHPSKPSTQLRVSQTSNADRSIIHKEEIGTLRFSLRAIRPIKWARLLACLFRFDRNPGSLSHVFDVVGFSQNSCSTKLSLSSGESNYS